MSVPQTILELVERFERNKDAYRSPHYNGTQLRREFLDPFFKALGWDVDNTAGHTEAYKDVIHEDAIKVGEATKAPDYCFRIGGTRKFFLEAKKPAVVIQHDVHPAFQLRRYAWTTKLPLSVLTNFEALAVYDCRVKPDQNHNAAVARILYIPYTRYAERWDEIRSLYVSEAAVEAAILKTAGQGPFRRIIDLGTGAGRMLTLLGHRAQSAVGLDLSRRPAHHRPHYLSAHLRRPRHRGLRSPPGADRRRAHLPAPV